MDNVWDNDEVDEIPINSLNSDAVLVLENVEVLCGPCSSKTRAHFWEVVCLKEFCSNIFYPFYITLKANETGDSSPMELEGCKRAFSFLESVGLPISIFISDRHRGIAKWVREQCPNTAQFFDIWHVARSIGENFFLKISKEKGCELIHCWMKGIRTHLYWCATSTKRGFEEMILANWKSFIRHVANKHTGHSDALFKKCAHGKLNQRKWIKIGM